MTGIIIGDPQEANGTRPVAANFGNCTRFADESEHYSAGGAGFAASRPEPGSSRGPTNLPNAQARKRPTSSITMKKAGTKTSESTVETSSPPMTAIAIGE